MATPIPTFDRQLMGGPQGIAQWGDLGTPPPGAGGVMFSQGPTDPNPSPMTDQGAYGGDWWSQNPYSDPGWGGTHAPGTGLASGGWTENQPSSGGGNPTDRSYVESQIAQIMQAHGITPGGRGSGPSDLAYYTDQAMATGGWTPDNAGYWQGRLSSDIQGGGGGGGAGGGQAGAAMSTNPAYGIFQNLSGGMSPQQIMQGDPGYQFAQQQGMNAIQNSAAARGTLLTGGTLKDLAQYTTGLASQDYGNIFNRQLQLAGLGSGIQNQAFGQNLSLASLGANAANAAANYGSGYGAHSVDLLTGSGNAQAAGSLNQGDIWGNYLGGLSGTLSGLYHPQGGGNPYSGVTPQQSAWWQSGNQGPATPPFVGNTY